MRKMVIAFAILALLTLSMGAFGQSSSVLSGTVTDNSGGVLPGAAVTAANVETNVVHKTLTNTTGVYTFSLQPGTYKVTVEMPGFQTVTKTDVKLGIAGQSRLNLEMAVAGKSVELQVTSSAQDLLIESSSSTGTVLQEKSVTELPLTSNDVMDFINVMGGVVKAEDPIFSNYQQTFAGVSAGGINVQRDGMTQNDVRYNSGIVTPQRINPELVGEFKMILSPVDAELGRGAGQVQIMTKSGSNAFHGSGVWNIQNTALDANEWGNNEQGVEPNWRNLNDYTIAASGPIRKNKTFFFATWDQQIARSRENYNVPVLTNCARKGIYRYFDGWNNGNLMLKDTVWTSGSQIRKSVDAAGNPLPPTEFIDHSQHNGILRFQSVLGRLSDTALEQIAADPVNCSQYSFDAANHGLETNSAWDTYRTQYDPTGYIERFTGLMPDANNFEIGDGLNVAGHRWVRRLYGSDTVFGNGEDNGRRSFTVKIDHNLSDKHRIGARYTYENDSGDSNFAIWPEANGGYGGTITRKPQSFAVNLTSTLKPTLLNEARFGLTRTATNNYDALENPATGKKMRSVLESLMSTADFPNYSGLPLVVGAGRGLFQFNVDTYNTGYSSSHPYGNRGAVPTFRGGNDPRWTAADTLTWIRGNHSFKVGGELRFQRSVQNANGAAGFSGSVDVWASAQGGNTNLSAPSGISWNGLMGQNAGNSSSGTYRGAYDLMTYMAGSIANIRQWYYVANSTAPYRWNDLAAGEDRQSFDLRNKEFSFFFKDDWKLSNALTLNLGVRFEYYGVPYVASGQTAALEGGSSRLFGISGANFGDWMPANPVAGPDDLMTRQIFVGPNSSNPDINVYRKDMNNWGPAIGFAYQLPWFGKGKTTLRGGYQLNYLPLGTFDDFAGVMARVTGMTYTQTYTGDNISNPYLDMTDLAGVLPISQFLDPAVEPLALRPLTDRSQSITVWNENIRNPYVQSLTLSVTRNIANNLTVDVRYIGTLSRKQTGTINLNAPNFIENGLVKEFDIVRAGGQSEVLNAMIPVGSFTRTGTGSDQLRAYTVSKPYLATGDYASMASWLAVTNGILRVPSSVRGAVLRQTGLFPENFIYANPQYSSANLVGNINHSNYHSMQAQVTLRPTHGLSLQATYTWSRNMGMNAVTDVRNRAADYGLLSSSRSHAFTSYGTYVLPFGPGQLLLRDSKGALKHVVDGWQLSWILSATSGLPGSIAGMNSLWGGGQVDRVGRFDPKSGHVSWAEKDAFGNYFGNKYAKGPDPQCAFVQAGLRSTCEESLKAIYLADENGNAILGSPVFQNAKPGTRGNFAPNMLNGPSRWTFDMAMGKSFEFMEGKNIEVRVDAQNILNHPTPSNGYYIRNARFTITYNPNFSLNNTDDFGYIESKAGHRTFQAKIRVSF